MAIVPNGKTRVMVAQNFSNPLAEGFDRDDVSQEEAGPISLDPAGAGTEELETGGALEEDVNEIPDENVINDDVSIGEEEEQEIAPKESGRKTLTTYIYEKLQSYGYPGRRLNDFKAEFVKESISPEGVKDIQVVIPDKKYPDERGFTDTVENEELKEISHEINQMFGLNFNGAERSEERWTIKFTSADMSNPEEDISHDNLDKVYGKPDAKNKQQEKAIGKPKSASSFREMIKDNKKEMLYALNKRKSGD